MTDLRQIFPSSAELPPGWSLDGDWWSASRGVEATGTRRVYLNGNGTDHELRFLVWPPGNRWRGRRDLWPDCPACHGRGRVVRPRRDPSPFLRGLFDGADEDAYDAADAEGLRRCEALNCEHGRNEPIYGASNARIRVPGFPAELLWKTGPRGMSYPTKAEILQVMAWCDEMISRINRRTPDERYP